MFFVNTPQDNFPDSQQPCAAEVQHFPSGSCYVATLRAMEWAEQFQNYGRKPLHMFSNELEVTQLLKVK